MKRQKPVKDSDAIRLLGMNVKRLREKAELSQLELSTSLRHSDQSYVCRIETGQVNVTISTIAAISKALGCSMAELVTEAENDEAEKIDESTYAASTR